MLVRADEGVRIGLTWFTRLKESYKSTKENEERMLVEHDTTRRQIADLILKREKLEEGMEVFFLVYCAGVHCVF